MATPDTTVAGGEALLEVGRVDEARQRVAAALAQSPGNADAWCLLARCHEAAGDYEAMLAAAGEATALVPDEARPHLLRGVALLRLERWDEAVEAATQAVRIAPENWFAHLLHGMALVALPGHWRAGRAAIKRAAALAPYEPLVHFVQGLLHQSWGRNIAARRAFQRALALDPQYVDALNSLGQVALRGGFLASAGRHFGSAAGAAPTDPQAAANLERVIHAGLGWAAITAWSTGLVLMFAMFPVAWAIAAAIVLAGGWWMRRIWRALPPGGRILVRHQLATDPRSRMRLGFAGVCALLAIAIGVASSIAGTTAGTGFAFGALGTLLGVLVVGAVAIVVVDARKERLGAGPSSPQIPFDEAIERWSALMAWRWFRAACPAALVVWILVIDDPTWPVRVGVGTVVLGLYALAAWSILRRVRRRQQGPPPPLILGRLMVPMHLAWLALVVYMVTAVYLPATLDMLSVATFVLVSATAIGYVVWLPVWLIRKIIGWGTRRPL